MKRIVATATAFALVFLAMGICIRVMLNISKVNRERREKDRAKVVASSMAAQAATETVNVWEYLRTTEPPAETAFYETNENGETIMPETVEGESALEEPTEAVTEDPVIIIS